MSIAPTLPPKGEIAQLARLGRFLLPYRRHIAIALLALVVAAILGRGAWRVLSKSAHILLEGVPDGVHLDTIAATLTARVPGVADVHHVHAWALTAEKPLLTLHASVSEPGDLGEVVRHMKAVLHSEFGITHSTIQVEHGRCPDHP